MTVYNPKGLDEASLPTIFGFVNTGSGSWLCCIALAEDGTCLGSHVCSHERYMPHDLGLIDNSRPDRQAVYRKHYPDGYRTEIVEQRHIAKHDRLMAAIDRGNAKSTMVDDKVDE